MATDDPRTTRNTAGPSGDQLEDDGTGPAESCDLGAAAAPNNLSLTQHELILKQDKLLESQGKIWWIMLVLTRF